MSRTSRRSRVAAANAQVCLDAALTIGARTPILLAQSLHPTAQGARETRRMVAEKVDALAEGATAAQFAWTALLMKATFGGVRSFDDLARGLAGVAEAAARPARRKARANARRLTGARKIV
jgi:hypothetical protein